MKHMLWLVLIIWLTACARTSTIPPPPPLVNVPRPVPPSVSEASTFAPSAIMFSGRPSATSVTGALSQALQTPEPWRFHGGTLVYTAQPGARYLIPVATGRLTTLRLQPGEALFAVTSGMPKCEDLKTEDAEVNLRCLSISDTVSGEGTNLQVHVAFRPGIEGLQTNALLTTSAGPYDLEIVSTTKRFLPVVQWEHPASATVARTTPTRVVGVGYAITSRRDQAPAWMPTQSNMWDDMKHTFIQFPEAVVGREFPVLYQVTHDLQERLANYRVQGTLMIIDGVFDAAVLRVGQDPTAELVDVRRTASYHYLVCPGHNLCPQLHNNSSFALTR